MTSKWRYFVFPGLMLAAVGLAAAQPGGKEAAQPSTKNAQPAKEAPAATPKKESLDSGVPAEHHPWGRFPIGSWKRTRVITENLDSLGNVTSTTIIVGTTTLVAADASEFTLRSEVITELSGKSFIGKPQTTVSGYNGNGTGEALTAKKTGDAEIEINGQKIPCQVRQISIEGMGTKTDAVVYVSASVSPYVLRKESTLTPAEGPKVTKSVEVIALAPVRVLSDRRNAAFIRTVERKESGTTTTMETICDDIPGGEVSRSTQEQNAAGKTLRRTTLELLDYSIADERPDEVWGGRKRVRHRPRGRRADEMQMSPRRG